ncbi:MAG: DJ-1/PfpI family protein [Erysipelotrichaceae bacterium]|nr:DJ-1/PfpI family protein [Erysipelotrichaceae bacterium]
MKALIIISNGMEECEALVTYDLLYRAGIETDLVGLQPEVTSSHNVIVKAHRLIEDVSMDDYDCLILPGGMPGTLNLEQNERVQKLISDSLEKDKYIAAICAAPSILIHRGLLKDHHFICFPGFENGLIPAKEKAVQDGKIITGKGMGAAIEFAHLIIANLISKEKADEILQKIQY